jgi:hypothetical protein
MFLSCQGAVSRFQPFQHHARLRSEDLPKDYLQPTLSLISLMMEAVNTPEMSVNFYEITRRNNHLYSSLETGSPLKMCVLCFPLMMVKTMVADREYLQRSVGSERWWSLVYRTFHKVLVNLSEAREGGEDIR